MSHHSEHMRLRPVLDLARQLDIATNPAPNAIFEAGSAGFQVWCIPQDYPQGWDGIRMMPGTFSKPCEYVGSAYWKWEHETIVALEIETSAYALAEQKPHEYGDWREIPPGETRLTIFNRAQDIEWLKQKIARLFALADVSLLPFAYEPAPLAQPGPYFLAYYVSDDDHYVVIVSPELDPLEFCQPGYELARTLEVWAAGGFPTDVLLRPEYGFPEPDLEPDEGPLVEQYENASRVGDDDWLEAAYEDRTDEMDG